MNINKKSKEKDMQIDRFKRVREEIEAKHREEMDRLKKQYQIKISSLLSEE